MAEVAMVAENAKVAGTAVVARAPEDLAVRPETDKVAPRKAKAGSQTEVETSDAGRLAEEESPKAQADSGATGEPVRTVQAAGIDPPSNPLISSHAHHVGGDIRARAQQRLD